MSSSSGLSTVTDKPLAQRLKAAATLSCCGAQGAMAGTTVPSAAAAAHLGTSLSTFPWTTHASGWQRPPSQRESENMKGLLRRDRLGGACGGKWGNLVTSARVPLPTNASHLSCSATLVSSRTATTRHQKQMFNIKL